MRKKSAKKQKARLKSRASLIVADTAGVEPATAWALMLAPGTRPGEPGELHSKKRLRFKIKNKKQKARLKSRASLIVADTAGVEPATAWFVARYSIQLSYVSAVGSFK